MCASPLVVPRDGVAAAIHTYRTLVYWLVLGEGWLELMSRPVVQNSIRRARRLNGCRTMGIEQGYRAKTGGKKRVFQGRR